MRYLQSTPLSFVKVILVIVMISSVGWAALAETTKYEDKPNSITRPIDCTKNKGAISEGFQLSADLENNTITKGDAVKLHLTLKNVSKEIREARKYYPEADYALCIVDPTGKVVTYENRFVPVYGAVNNFLKQNEKIEDTFYVNNVYTFSMEGIYQITAGRKVLTQDGNGYVDVISNTVQLIVIQSKESGK